MIVIDNVDWKLLRKQKLTLINLATLCTKESEDITGIIHLIDHIQDESVKTGEVSVWEVFGVKDQCIIDMENECFLIAYNDQLYVRYFNEGDMSVVDEKIQDAEYWHSVGVNPKNIKVGETTKELVDISIGYDSDDEKSGVMASIYWLKYKGKKIGYETQTQHENSLPVYKIEDVEKELGIEYSYTALNSDEEYVLVSRGFSKKQRGN